MIRAALQLAEQGLRIFPCRPSSKLPASLHGVLDATADRATIETWWRHQPTYNIGVACGEASQIFALDVDGVDGEETLRKLEREHEPLPASVEVITPRPGRHVYFRMPVASPVRNSTGKLGPHLDIRGTGGYTLMPPSRHPSGRLYCWSVDSARTVASAPAWLLSKISERPVNSTAPTPPSEWRALMADGVPEGRRDCTLARISGYLLRHHIDPVFAAGLVEAFNATRCIPPLPEKDVARIVNSIAAKELKRRDSDRG